MILGHYVNHLEHKGCEMKNFLGVLVVVVITGCANQPMEPMSREVWKKETTRVYKNFTKEEIFAASEKLFRLWDGDDFSFSYTPNQLAAVRKWMFFALIAYAEGSDHWQVSVTDSSDQNQALEVRVSLREISSSSSLVVGGPTVFMGPAFGQENFVNTPYIYRLFWSRLDYLLGVSDSWYSCKDWKKANDLGLVELGQPCRLETVSDYAPGELKQK